MTTVTLSKNTRERLRATRFGTTRHKTAEETIRALLEEHERSELRAMFEEIDPQEYQASLVEDELLPGVTDYSVEEATLLAQESEKQ